MGDRDRGREAGKEGGKVKGQTGEADVLVGDGF